jgi:hypothetical protein
MSEVDVLFVERPWRSCATIPQSRIVNIPRRKAKIKLVVLNFVLPNGRRFELIISFFRSRTHGAFITKRLDG